MDTVELVRDCEVIAIPSGTSQVLPKGTVVRILQTRGGNSTVLSNIHAMFRIDAKDADALGFEAHAATNDARKTESFSEALVWETLRSIYDPEIPVNVVDLGLIYSCEITPREKGGNRITIRMAMTSPGCGMANVLKADVEGKLRRLPDVAEVHVEVVFDPPWNQSRMSEAARLQLGFDSDRPTATRLTQIIRKDSA
jgi:probable FeS assembly SUF system protein SufT